MLTIALLIQLLCVCFAANINRTQKCPSLESNQQLQRLRKQCVPYENATVPQSLSTATEQQLLCVLYLANYNAACGKQLQLAAAPIQNFTAASVCTDQRWVIEGAKTLLSSEFVCRGVCVNFERGGVVDICNAAFYLDAIGRVSAKTIEADDSKQKQKVEAAPKDADSHDVENPAQPADLPLNPPKEEARAEQPPESPQQSAVEENEPPQPPVVSATDKKVAEKPEQTSDVANAQNDNDLPPSNNIPDTGSRQQNVEPEKQQKEIPPQQEPKQPPQQEQKQPPPQQENPQPPLQEEQQSPQQEQQQPKQQSPPAQQQKEQSQPPAQANIDSPPIDNNSNANPALLNAENENPDEDLKLDDADDLDDDDVDDQGELKYNKPNIDIDDDSGKAPAAVPQKPDKTYSSPGINNQTTVDGDSYFFSYFMMLCIIIVLFYVGYHNKQKIRAIVLEGPRGRRQYRSRRPNSANYHKLDSNLEEAITSSTANKSSSHVIY